MKTKKLITATTAWFFFLSDTRWFYFNAHIGHVVLLHTEIEEENVFQQIYADAFGITAGMNRIYINPRLSVKL